MERRMIPLKNHTHQVDDSPLAFEDRPLLVTETGAAKEAVVQATEFIIAEYQSKIDNPKVYIVDAEKDKAKAQTAGASGELIVPYYNILKSHTCSRV